MAPLVLRYLVWDPDRHGTGRYYVRVPGRKKVRIRAPLNEDGTASEAFMAEYWSARRADDEPDQQPAKRVAEGSFESVLRLYFDSPAFLGHDPETQRAKKNVLNRYSAGGAGPIVLKAFRKADIEASRDKRKSTPGAADNLVKYLRAFFAWAIKHSHLDSNPAIGVDKINTASEGWHSWTPEEVRQFEGHYPIGTTARLAITLIMCTGGRRGDVCALGKQHETGGYLSFIQHKNRVKRPTRIEIPIRPELRAAIDATVTGDLTYIVSAHGRPFTRESFGNWFRDRCVKAGLPHCSAHGIRKASATILAEHGASAPELCAIFGWSKLETAEIYIRAARKKVMSRNAFDRLPDSTIVPLSGRFSDGGTKRGKNRG